MINELDKKKLDEKVILERYRKTSGLDFVILDFDAASTIYPDYNNENPDFIVSLNGEYIGIELFRLCLTETKPTIEYGGGKYKNYMQKKSEHPNVFNTIEEAQKYIERRKADPKKYPLQRQDDLLSILSERLSSKRTSVQHYVTECNWLLGYADETFNINVVENIYRDNIQKDLEQFVQREFTKIPNINKVILFEPDNPNEKIFEIAI